MRSRRARVRPQRRSNRDFDLLDIARLLLLAFLAADRLVPVLDALALVGLGLPVRADFRRDLADALLVRPADRDRGRLLADDLQLRRDRVDDLVAIAELQHEVLALHRGA